MITVNKLIEKLQELKDKGYGDLVCIYSSDDAGNSYHTVYNEPSEYLVEDINEYELATAFDYDEKDNVIDFVPNCIIIN
jgi:Mg/Co/Ni transporter MgtE